METETIPVGRELGERFANSLSSEGFQAVLDRNAVGHLRPDVTSAGRITAMRRIIAAADAVGTRVSPHVFGTAVAIVAGVEVLATVSGPPLLEFDERKIPFEMSYRSRRSKRWAVVPVSDRFGLGIEIDRDALAELPFTRPRTRPPSCASGREDHSPTEKAGEQIHPFPGPLAHVVGPVVCAVLRLFRVARRRSSGLRHRGNTSVRIIKPPTVRDRRDR